jgi:hypothetical protein
MVVGHVGQNIQHAHALVAAAFFGAAAFLGAAFLAAGFCALATRPDLVLVRTVSGFSAWKQVSQTIPCMLATTWATNLGRGSSGLLGRGSLLRSSGLLSSRRLLGSGAGSGGLLRGGLLRRGGLLGGSGGAGGGLLGGSSLLGLGLLLGQLGATGGALGLLEDTLLDTVLQGLVEERVEHVVRRDIEVVVGLDILLQGLAATEWGQLT